MTRNAVALHQVTILRQVGRWFTPLEPGEGAQPELAIAVREAAREQRGYGGDIGVSNLAAA